MTTPESPLESIFFAALAKGSPAERAGYLDEACGDDQEMRQRVERLLKALPRIGNFLEADTPAPLRTGVERTVREGPDVAQYRAGDWKAAVAALKKSAEIGKGPNALDGFSLAMACWQLGEKDQARAWYEKAVLWMEKHQPNSAEFRRFRAEAEQLLGIEGTP